MSEQEMVNYFVDGTEVDLHEMVRLGLVVEDPDGEFYLTERGIELI